MTNMINWMFPFLSYTLSLGEDDWFMQQPSAQRREARYGQTVRTNTHKYMHLRITHDTNHTYTYTFTCEKAFLKYKKEKNANVAHIEIHFYYLQSTFQQFLPQSAFSVFLFLFSVMMMYMFLMYFLFLHLFLLFYCILLLLPPTFLYPSLLPSSLFLPSLHSFLHQCNIR